jgi:chromosome segregation ATPase
VIDSYEEAGFNRQQARELLAELSTRVRQDRTWPPTTVTLEAERQELEKAEKQWRGLKGGPIRAISLVQQLGSLSARYQTLVEKLRQGSERLAQEQTQVEDIETEIDELAQYWESQWRTYRDNPMASQEMRGLLDSVEQQQSQLKRQYRQGAKSYNQIIQELKALQRKLKYFQAALDDDHAIDSGGRVHTRR